jgi:hypothetical protein
MTTTTRLYAVSSGNGNDGVSHSFPDYYVRTDEPYRLAALAMVSSFKSKFKQAAANAVQIDGEADYTISAVIYNPSDVDPSEASEDGDDDSYCDANGAWQIIEVFPDDEPRDSRPVYDSLADCFGEDDLALVPE